MVAANVSVVIERNELLDSAEAAMQLMGTGAVVRGNRISGGAAMGIVAENARAAVIEDNEIRRAGGLRHHGQGLGRHLVRGNRIHNSGYGLAFVLGESAQPQHRDRQHHHRTEIQRHRRDRRFADPAR